MDNFDFPTLVPQFDSILSRGLCKGVGVRDGQMCIEAAICTVLGLPHGDNPQCVSSAVRSFKISLNDSNWSSPAARAVGLRALGIAQIGSKGVVDDREFSKRLTEKVIRKLIPDLFRRIADKYPKKTEELRKVALRCEIEGTKAAADAAAAAPSRDFYLLMVAQLALEVLIDLKSPGAMWLQENEK